MNDSYLSKKMEAISIATPEYLKSVYLDIDTESVELVFIKKEVEDILSPKDVRTLRETDSLDVTGSPLQVSLYDNDSWFDIGQHSQEVHNEHGPVDIESARFYVNQQVRTQKNFHVPICVLIDGKNAQKTILMGVSQSNKLIFTCVLNVIGKYPEGHERISIQSMQRSHQTSARVRDLEIDYLIHFKYYTHGRHLHNMENIHLYFGTICIELVCDEICEMELPMNLRGMKKKMVLQVVAGHELSEVHFLWLDFCLLQNYLISSSEIDNLTVISSTPIPLSDILSGIQDLVVNVAFLRKKANTTFDLKNIRSYNVFDKLWDILKYCENVAALRSAFHYFFEKLTTCDVHIKIPEGNNTVISTIVKGLVGGKLAVPTLTHQQSLEFLFEIGAERLMNDYRMILKHFHATSGSSMTDSISIEWKKLHDLNSKQAKEKGTSDDLNMSKLSYLARLHVAVEMIYLLMDHEFISQETFDQVCKCIYTKYVEKNVLSALQMGIIHEFEVDIDAVEENIRKEKPVSWTMQMKSTVRKTEIITAYHLSQFPIVPRAIYDEYDISKELKSDELAYYVYMFSGNKDFTSQATSEVS